MRGIILTVMLAAPALAFAQGSQVNNQNQKIVGMAGAGTALFVDEATMVYNPGALVKMDHNAVQIGGTAALFNAAFQESGSMTSYNTRSQVTPPFAAYGTWAPEGAIWRAGLAVYTPFGGAVDWGTEWPGRFELTNLRLQAVYIQPTVSVKITEQLGVGAGFVYNIGTVDLGRSLPGFQPDGQPASVEMNGTGTGIGYNLGIHYDIPNIVSIGLNYRSKVNTRLSGGDATFNMPADLAAMYPNTQFSGELPLPGSLSLGLAFPVNEKLDLALDGTMLNYGIYQELAFSYETELIPDVVSQKRYTDSYSVRLGANYKVQPRLTLRAGVGYISTPVREEYVYPETPDNNRYVIGAGLTYDVTPRWEINAAYAFQHVLPRTTTNAEINLSGRYETYIHAPGVSIAYKW